MKVLIEKAYEIFGQYKLNGDIDICTQCCATEEEKMKLINTNLKEINYELIYRHNTSARSLNPPINEFKYFLPRYLELISQNQFPSHSIELSLRKLEKFEAEDFTNDEFSLITEFCEQYFRRIISEYPCPEDEMIDSILVMIHKTKIDFHRILEIWETDNSQSGNKHFKDLIEFGISNRKNKLNNGFSDKQLNEIILDWIKDPKLFESKYQY